MKYFKTFFVILIACVFIVSCKSKLSDKIESTGDFLKIETEYLNSDLTVESKEAIAKKYGYTLKAFTDFEERVEKDEALKKEVGELMMNEKNKVEK